MIGLKEKRQKSKNSANHKLYTQGTHSCRYTQSERKKHGAEFLQEHTGKPVNYISTQWENEMLCSTAT